MRETNLFKARVFALLLSSCTYLVTMTPWTLSSQEPQGALKLSGSEVSHIGAAEVKEIRHLWSIDPAHQPEMYWHDPEWSLDLLIPQSSGDHFAVRVRSSLGETAVISLPESYEEARQVRQILRTPGDKAIVQEMTAGLQEEFFVIDLKERKLVDHVDVEAMDISPNRRFILFENWRAHTHWGPEDPVVGNRFFLYDLLKSPRENVCGYSPEDRRHQQLAEDMRGLQVYPQPSGNTGCAEPNDPSDDNDVLDWAWAGDSSKLVMADIKGSVVSLVLVTMPVTSTDLPKTSVYKLEGARDVCVGSTAADGEPNCDRHVIQSLGWDGDSVKAVFRHQFGTPLNLSLTIPISTFVPIGK